MVIVNTMALVRSLSLLLFPINLKLYVLNDMIRGDNHGLLFINCSKGIIWSDQERSERIRSDKSGKKLSLVMLISKDWY